MLLRIDDHVEIDMSYITCAEYQLFIDEVTVSRVGMPKSRFLESELVMLRSFVNG
jgi:hypothetical protein